ncbi:MAG: hypothetical protein LBF58_09630 [Deltaproteobacteria bacterium]|jgi:hypothetical protein|nr:hypothetical protein [Deltaproteobacteria bacterium]
MPERKTPRPGKQGQKPQGLGSDMGYLLAAWTMISEDLGHYLNCMEMIKFS